MPEGQDQPKPCIFCAILEGKIPAKRVYEDNDSIAFLDINPRSAGMTIVAPRRHYSQMNDDPSTSLKIFQSSQNVAKMIKSALSPDSIAVGVIPSEEVPHFHVRLYPVYGDERPIFEGQANKMSDQDLDAIMNKIKSEKPDLFATPTQEKKKEVDRSAEDVKYLKGRIDIA